MNRVEPEIIINGSWKLGKRIGKGSFGAVHMGKNIRTGKSVAIKLEHCESKEKMLEHEHRVYQKIYHENYAIPEVYWFGTSGEYRILVMEAVGLNLETLLGRTKKFSFTQATVAEIAIQTLLQLEHMHNKHYIHRDLKPENLLCGITGRLEGAISLIDMGLAKKFKSDDNVHIKHRQNKMIGTARYCSIASHDREELSRKDDLISLGYILIYFSKGELPWQGLDSPKNSSKKARFEHIKKCKQETTTDQLCHNLPTAFHDYMNYVCELSFTERPSYKYLRDLFWSLLSSNKLTFRYCWPAKR